MMTSPPEPPTLRSFSTIASSSNRRSYSCYNCNHAFYITPTTEDTSISPPSSFRCPRCLQRHLIPRHAVYPPPAPPPPPPSTSDSTPAPGIFTYYTSDDFESDYDYDSDDSLLSFTFPNYHIPESAVKSLIDSLPIKTFALNPADPHQSCSICMEDFGNDYTCDEVVELPCKHCFHRDCVGEWLKRNNTCPMCRYKLSLDPYLDKFDLAAAQAATVAEYNELLEFHLDQVGAVAMPPAREPFPPVREPFLRRVNAEVSLSAIAEAEASGSNWRALSTNGGDRGRWFDPMHDDDGDTLMVDA